jgi:hypothetical protein
LLAISLTLESRLFLRIVPWTNTTAEPYKYKEARIRIIHPAVKTSVQAKREKVSVYQNAIKPTYKFSFN